MAGEARVTSRVVGPFVTLRVEGSLNETFLADSLLKDVAGKDVVIDVQDVARITSFGSRQWIRAMDLLAQQVKHVFIEHCSIGFVSQMNMIRGFAGKATVLSISAPLVCTSCDHEMTLAVDLRSGVPKAVNSTCPKCKGAADLAEGADTYLAFAPGHVLAEAGPDLVALVRQYDALRTAGVPAIGEQTGPHAIPKALQLTPLTPSAGRAAQKGKEAATAAPTSGSTGSTDAAKTTARPPSSIAAPTNDRAAPSRWAVTNEVFLAFLLGFLFGALSHAVIGAALFR